MRKNQCLLRLVRTTVTCNEVWQRKENPEGKREDLKMLKERSVRKEQSENAKATEGVKHKLSLLERFHHWTNTRRLDKLRKYALQYVKLLDEWMKIEGFSRQQRRQYFRELVSKGRFS